LVETAAPAKKSKSKNNATAPNGTPAANGAPVNPEK
jgi:hypothetical protein